VNKICDLVLRVYLAAMPTIGILWILSVPDYFQWGLVTAQVVVIVLALANGAVFLKYPYGDKAGPLELVLAFACLAVWVLMSASFEEWMMLMAERPTEMWAPGIVAILLMMEGVRKCAGRVIAGLVWTMIIYAFLGDHLPGVFEAAVFPPTKTVVFLYADHNGIPGIVLRIVVELVLSFILFGKLMELSGATAFFNDLAMAWMGHRRGGPAKVAVVASAAFGSISGSAVANIMSTGIITIPLMKRTGFQAKYAAAIEAVASNGGQIAPPVMGATAFIIAEFLEVAYGDVALAALLPAGLYFMVLFLQVDGVAVRFGIKGLPREDLPKVLSTIISGWVFIIPLGVLIYFLLGLGYRAGLSGMYACGVLFLLMIARNRRLPNMAELKDFFVGGGENLIPLLMIGGGAGVIIGLMNSTGLGFQLSLVLTTVGANAGILVMLLLTALVCIVLGMGMPTAAVYVVLVSIIAPALVEMEIPEMPAHFFIFYFGLLSLAGHRDRHRHVLGGRVLDRSDVRTVRRRWADQRLAWCRLLDRRDRGWQRDHLDRAGRSARPGAGRRRYHRGPCAQSPKNSRALSPSTRSRWPLGSS
jgi:TRAP transporter 4TM/12TM fusion protein